ncbi:uncharacterized protein LOC134834901 [Culicoides brevitarsis]|uniref:uncharacterized protein LOC134834901 n=1 Tax=Culicoides brevitarsis TaxID=469753 RepID=UPI00307BC605
MGLKMAENDSSEIEAHQMHQSIMEEIITVRYLQQAIEEVSALETDYPKLKKPEISHETFEILAETKAKLVQLISEANAKKKRDEKATKLKEDLAKAIAELQYNLKLAQNPKEHLAQVKAEIAKIEARKEELKQQAKDIENFGIAIMGDRYKKM